MMREIELVDHLGDLWRLMLPCVYKKNRNGLWVMWVYVAKGPACLTEGAYRYQQIPLPLFTAWWE